MTPAGTNQGCQIHHTCYARLDSIGHVTYAWDIWMSHVTHMNESWGLSNTSHLWCSPRYTQDMSRIWMSRVTPMDELRGRSNSSHLVCPQRYTHTNKSCHTYEWVMTHIEITSGCQIHQTNHARQDNTWNMSHRWRSRVTHTNESWGLSNTSHLLCTPRYASDMWYVWISHEGCQIHQTNYARLDTRIRMSQLTPMNELCHAYEWEISLMWMRHVTHVNASCHTRKCVMSHT